MLALFFSSSETYLRVDFDSGASLFTFVASEKLVSVALTTAVTQRLTRKRHDVVVKHGDVVTARASDFGQCADFFTISHDASIHAFSLGREPVGVAFAAAILEAATFS